MPRIIGGGIQGGENVELKMQFANVGPLACDPAIGVYGPARLIASPRLNGGIIPIWLQALATAPGANITLSLTPTFSDLSVGPPLLWTPFTALKPLFQAGLGFNSLGSIPEAIPAVSQGVDTFYNAPADLSALWGTNIWLTKISAAIKSSGAADAGTVLLSYYGLYT